MHQDEHDELWELLGKSPRKQARPSFAQDVLRAVRLSEPAPEPGFMEWLRQGWNWLALTGGAAAVLALLVATGSQAPQTTSLATRETTTIDAALTSTDFTLISNLDVLLALDDKNPWLESSPY